MILLLILSLVSSLRLDEKKKFILSWIKQDLDVSAFFADDHVDTSVLIVNVNQEGDDTDTKWKSGDLGLNLGTLPYHSTQKDLRELSHSSISKENLKQCTKKYARSIASSIVHHATTSARIHRPMQAR